MAFKDCSCGENWQQALDFLEDQLVDYRGLKIDRQDGSTLYSFFFFNHRADGCATTLAIPLGTFSDFIDEPIPEKLQAGEEGCEGRCLNIGDGEECHNRCQNAPYRKFARKYFGDRPGHSCAEVAEEGSDLA